MEDCNQYYNDSLYCKKCGTLQIVPAGGETCWGCGYKGELIWLHEGFKKIPSRSFGVVGGYDSLEEAREEYSVEYLNYIYKGGKKDDSK